MNYKEIIIETTVYNGQIQTVVTIVLYFNIVVFKTTYKWRY